jgi:hypothetical protein
MVLIAVRASMEALAMGLTGLVVRLIPAQVTVTRVTRMTGRSGLLSHLWA